MDNHDLRIAELENRVTELEGEVIQLSRLVEERLNGARQLPISREALGRMARESWVRWALTQPNMKESWVIPFDFLSEEGKESYCKMAEDVARWTLLFDASGAAMKEKFGK